MNDHRFSYPVVMPLRGVTISGHSSPPAPGVPLDRADTAWLAAGDAGDAESASGPEWASERDGNGHPAYLSGLQRVGRDTLAHATLGRR